MNPEEIRIAKQHTTYAVTTYGSEGERHTIRYIKRHPYETIVGPVFKSKKALNEFAGEHSITIAYWN